MQLKRDREADAIYITLREGAYAYGEDLDHERRVDYDIEGHPIGVELLNVSGGVELDDLPEQGRIVELLAKENVRIFA